MRPIVLAVLIALVAADAVAQQVASKFDTKLPIEISSDQLEVLQQQSQAIFRGNVIAVQGQVRLKSDIMVVHYIQKSDQAKDAPKPKPVSTPAASDSQASMGAISSIDVEGHVFVATPEESAEGEKGDYNVANKTIHLFGSNVVLTRGKNILRGTALEYNLETGRSLLTNENGDVTSNSGGGRVRGVFVPDQQPKPGQPAKPKPDQTSKSDSPSKP